MHVRGSLQLFKKVGKPNPLPNSCPAAKEILGRGGAPIFRFCVEIHLRQKHTRKSLDSKWFFFFFLLSPQMVTHLHCNTDKIHTTAEHKCNAWNTASTKLCNAGRQTETSRQLCTRILKWVPPRTEGHPDLRCLFRGREGLWAGFTATGSPAWMGAAGWGSCVRGAAAPYGEAPPMGYGAGEE